jgi:general secretion pathway protein H
MEAGGMKPVRRRQSGFTLVELMVVIVIVGLAATVVVLAIPDQGGSVYAEAERFAARAKSARDTAIVESRPMSLELGPRDYVVARRLGGAWQEAGRYRWSEDTQIESAAGGTRFDSTGLAQPLHLTLRRGQRQVAIEIGHDGSVQIRR